MLYDVSTSCRGSNCVLCALNPCFPHLIKKPGKLATAVNHWGSAGGQHSAFARKTFRGVVIPLSGWNDCLDIPFNRSLLITLALKFVKILQWLRLSLLWLYALVHYKESPVWTSEPDSVGSFSLMFVFSGPWVTHSASVHSVCFFLQSGEACHQTYCTLSNYCETFLKSP